MDKLIRNTLFLSLILIPLLGIVSLKVMARLHTTENATVTFSDCTENCTLTGTLGQHFFNGLWYIENGSERVYFSLEQVVVIEHPLPEHLRREAASPDA